MSKKEEKRERVLLVKDNEGEFRVTIPADAKLTLGPAVPYQRRNGYEQPGSNCYCLRVYKGNKENILAVFNRVEWFRDMTVPVEKLILREAGKKVWKSDEKGYKVEQEVKREQTWETDLAHQLNSHSGKEEF